MPMRFCFCFLKKLYLTSLVFPGIFFEEMGFHLAPWWASAFVVVGEYREYSWGETEMNQAGHSNISHTHVEYEVGVGWDLVRN